MPVRLLPPYRTCQHLYVINILSSRPRAIFLIPSLLPIHLLPGVKSHYFSLPTRPSSFIWRFKRASGANTESWKERAWRELNNQVKGRRRKGLLVKSTLKWASEEAVVWCFIFLCRHLKSGNRQDAPNSGFGFDPTRAKENRRLRGQQTQTLRVTSDRPTSLRLPHFEQATSRSNGEFYNH